jgi:hypothetical protein
LGKRFEKPAPIGDILKMPHATPIDRLVEWAYIELLKRGTVGTLAQQWDTLRDYGERGWTAIDDERVNADLHMPAALGPPHVDALTIERAVQGLASTVALDWSSYRVLLLGELLAVAPDLDPLAGCTWNEVALVETFARMGSRPKWDIGKPIARRVMAANNRGAALIGGKLAAKGRYTIGTTCAIRWEPSIERVAQARAEYLVWRKALESLAGTLKAWTLADHVPLPPSAPAEPWLKAGDAKLAAIGGVAPAWRTWEQDPARRKGPRQRATPGKVPA